MFLDNTIYININCVISCICTFSCLWLFSRK